MIVPRGTIESALAELSAPWRQDASALLETLAEILWTDATRLGFVNEKDPQRIWDRHILDSLRIAAILSEGSVVDVGSGAGLPGLAVAMRSDTDVCLVDTLKKRTDFLSEVVAKLGLKSRVVWGRAEDLGRSERESFDQATCRALAQPVVAIEYLAPLLRVGGSAILPVGRAFADLDRTADAASQLGFGAPEVQNVGDSGETALVFVKISPTPTKFPRKPGIAVKRPLS